MILRPRRLRRTSAIRDMVRETNLLTKDFIIPLFVKHGKSIKDPILSVPGHYHFSVDKIVDEVKEVHSMGIPSVILFGLPAKKDPVGSSAYDDNGVVQRAISAIKEKIPLNAFRD